MDFRRMADNFITKLAGNDIIVQKIQQQKVNGAIQKTVIQETQCKAAIKTFDKKLNDTYGDVPGDIQFIISNVKLEYMPTVENTLIIFNGKAYEPYDVISSGAVNNTFTLIKFLCRR